MLKINKLNLNFLFLYYTILSFIEFLICIMFYQLCLFNNNDINLPLMIQFKSVIYYYFKIIT